MAPSKLIVALKQALVVSMPPAYGATAINRLRGNHSRIHHQPTQEVIMEIAVIIGGLVGVFVGLAALILWFPYDK